MNIFGLVPHRSKELCKLLYTYEYLKRMSGMAIHFCVYTHTHTHKHTHANAHIQIQVHTHIYTHTYIQVGSRHIYII